MQALLQISDNTVGLGFHGLGLQETSTHALQGINVRSRSSGDQPT
jgi:hypothetical protein